VAGRGRFHLLKIDPVTRARTTPSIGSPPALPGRGEVGIPRDEDPELLALPAPRRRERGATLLVMGVTAIASVAMAMLLAGEARYALSSGQPAELGELAKLAPGAELANRYVRGNGLLATSGAVKYGRPAEGDSFRLAPIATNPKIWVEIRVPEGFEGPRFVPPSTFAGRLVPLRQAGIRHAGLGGSTAEAGVSQAVPEDAWLLVDGDSPRASRWAVALVALLIGFAGWNLLGIARIVRRVRDDRSSVPEDEGSAPSTT